MWYPQNLPRLARVLFDTPLSYVLPVPHTYYPIIELPLKQTHPLYVIELPLKQTPPSRTGSPDIHGLVYENNRQTMVDILNEIKVPLPPA